MAPRGTEYAGAMPLPLTRGCGPYYLWSAGRKGGAMSGSMSGEFRTQAIDPAGLFVGHHQHDGTTKSECWGVGCSEVFSELVDLPLLSAHAVEVHVRSDVFVI